MIGTIVEIDYDGDVVRSVVLDLHIISKTSPVVVKTLDRIGQGSFGTVYRACCDFSTTDIALKIATGKPARLREEIAVMSKVCTQGKINLSRILFGALSVDATIVVLGLELCLPQTLHDYLLLEPISSKGEMLFLGYQTVCAVAAMHELGCCHRDVKHQNFVFDTEANLKLIDYGLASSTLAPPPGDVVAGTVSFMAPEMARNALSKSNRVSVGGAADMWALGIVLFSIFTQKNPFPQVSSGGAHPSKEKQSEALLRRVAAGEYVWPTDKKVPAALAQLVESLLVTDPAKRPTAASVLQDKVWADRHRMPSDRLLTFLGIRDADFLLRASPIHREALHNAIATRTEQVNRSLNESAVAEAVDPAVASGDLSTQRFAGGGGAKAAVREISVAIAEEAKRSQQRSRSRRAVREAPPHKPSQRPARPVGTLEEETSAPTIRVQRNPLPASTHSVATYSSAEDLIAAEKRTRLALQALLLATMQEHHKRMVLRLEEDVLQCNLFWLEPQRRRQAAHAHKFKELHSVSKGYEYGFVCDMCDWEILPNGKSLSYVHCNCGMDMCPGCYAKMRQRPRGPEPPAKALISKEPAVRTKRSRSGDGHDEQQPPRSVPRRQQPLPAAPKAQVSGKGASRRSAVVAAPPPPPPPTKSAAVGPRQSLNQAKASTVVPPAANKWQPMARLAAVSADQEASSGLPTDDERRMLLGGEWVRYFHFFPHAQTSAHNSLAFIYRVQPDRTGAIFLTNECALFGAVSSSMERKMLCIEELDLEEGRDRTTVLSLSNAKCSHPREFDLLHQTATIDANLLKQQRCPGIVSVYQNPTSAVRCNGDSFVYVRWFRCSEDNHLTAVLLSNGAIQVFVGREYELRWMDDTRKFMVRSSGRCELINPATFKLMPQIEKLLFAVQ